MNKKSRPRSKEIAPKDQVKSDDLSPSTPQEIRDAIGQNVRDGLGAHSYTTFNYRHVRQAPTPSPNEIRQLYEIHPDLAQKAMHIAERLGTGRMDNERVAIEGSNANERLGIWMSGGLKALLIVAAAIAFLGGSTTAGWVLLSLFGLWKGGSATLDYVVWRKERREIANESEAQT